MIRWQAAILIVGLGCGCVLTAGTPAQASGPRTFTVRGAGWGHGVGLSQYGAYGMAREGSNAVQIVEHYFPHTRAVPFADNRDIRVNIGHQLASAKLRGVALKRGGGSAEVQLDQRTPLAVSKGVEVGLRASGRRVRVTLIPAVGATRVLGKARRVTVRWAGTRSPGHAGTIPTAMRIAKSGGSYRSTRFRFGTIDVATVAGALEVVNPVRIHDEYLSGIAEVPVEWPVAALRAQAIAARSYALTKTAIRAACRCQSDDGSGPYFDQTFNGWSRVTSYRGTRWRDAVRATTTSGTTGRTLVYRGKPITAFYFSSSGGRTANSEDVWGTKVPWARSVDDHWSLNPKYNDSGNAAWKAKRSQPELARAFGLADVVKVVVTARYASTAVKTVRAYSSSGSRRTISGHKLVSRLGLRSSWVWSIS